MISIVLLKKNCILMSRLVKSDNKMWCGVLAGTAEYLQVDPTIVRMIYTVMTVFCLGLPGLFLYFILALIMPDND